MALQRVNTAITELVLKHGYLWTLLVDFSEILHRMRDTHKEHTEQQKMHDLRI
jgi:hypothetical protein